MAAVSSYELAVAEALRRHAWRWLTLDDTWRASGVRRRVVRHHLQRMVAAGAVERAEIPPTWGVRYRWRPDAPPTYVAALGAAAATDGRQVEPVASPPTHCRRGHALQGDNVHVWSDGRRGCGLCGEWRRYDGG